MTVAMGTTSITTTGNVTVNNITFPAHSAGDMLITIWAGEPGGGITIPTPYHEGWCGIRESSNTSGVTQWFVFWKFADGTEPSPVVFTTGGTMMKCRWVGVISGADPYRGIETAFVRGSAAVAPDSPNLSLPAGAEEVLWLLTAAVGADTSQVTGAPTDSDGADMIHNGGGFVNERTSLGVAWRVENLASWDPAAWTATGMVGGANGAVQVTQAIYPAVTHTHPDVLGHVRTYITGTLASPQDISIDVPTDTAAMLVWAGGGSGTTLTLDPSGTPQALTLIEEDIQTNESCHWFVLEAPPTGAQTLRVTATGASTVPKTLHVVYVDRYDSVTAHKLTGTAQTLSDTLSLAANELFLTGHLDGSTGTSAEVFEIWRDLTLDGVALRRNEVVQGNTASTSAHTMVSFGRTGAGGSQPVSIARKTGATERHTAIFLSVFAVSADEAFPHVYAGDC